VLSDTGPYGIMFMNVFVGITGTVIILIMEFGLYGIII
jgi:hypothetical protein